MALKVGEMYASMGLDDSQFNSKLAAAGRNFQNMGQNMVKAGKNMTLKVTAPIVGLATASLMTVATFDDSMSSVQAISGATGEELAKLRDMAKDLGSSTAHSASAAADAMGYLALAGWDTNQILEATPHMLSLASAASMDLATAADIVSDTMSAFQMDASKANEAADIFAKTAASANTNVEQLGQAMKYAGPAANAAGMSLQETSAVLGILADNGIKGSMAGTAFNSMLSDLRNASEDGKVAVGDFNVELYRADGTMRDLGSVMQDVEHATKDMTAQQRDMAMGAIFGERAIKGVNIMLAEGSQRYYELEDSIHDSAGAAAEMAETMEDNLGGSIRAMKSAIEGLMISFGEVLAPVVRQVAGFIADLAQNFSNLSERQRTTIVIIGGLLAAIGPVLIILGTLISSIGAVGGALAGVALGPAVLIGAAIAGLVAGLVWLWRNNEDFRAKVTQIWDQLKVMFEAALNMIMSIIQWFVATARAFWDRFGDGILAVITIVFDTIVSIISGAINVITGIFNVFGAIFSGDWDRLWLGVRQIVSGVWGTITSVIRNALKLILGLVGVDFTKLRTNVLNVFRSLGTGIRNIWEGILSGIRGVINRIIRAINGFITGLNRISFSAPSWVPFIGGRSWGVNIRRIPYLATGGIVTQPTLAMMGEGGKKEAVLPLENSDFIDQFAQKIAEVSGGGDGPAEIILKVGETELGRATVKSIRKLQRQTGANLVNV